MSQQIVQINYQFGMPAGDLEQAMLPAAPGLAATPGLQWKVWLMNAAGSEAGGIYLFEDEASARAFATGAAVRGLKASAGISDVSVKLFGISEELTRITRGPIGQGVAV